MFFLQDEVDQNIYGTLPGTQYFFTNCICNCRMLYVVSKCNCTLDFIYPSGNNHQCTLSDLKCLIENNGKRNFEFALSCRLLYVYYRFV